MEEVIMSYSELVGFLSEVSTLAISLQQIATNESQTISNAISQVEQIQNSTNQAMKQNQELQDTGSVLENITDQMSI